MQRNFTLLSPEEFKNKLKCGATLDSLLPPLTGDSNAVATAQTAHLTVDTAACARHDGDGDERTVMDAYHQFARNCLALSLKANSALLQHAEAICSEVVVDLTRNFIGETGLQAVTPLVAQNPKLRELHLPANGIENNAVVFLCRSLKAHPSLERLNLSHNPGVSLAAGLALHSLVAQNPPLRHVELDGTLVPEALRNKIARLCQVKQEPRPCASTANNAGGDTQRAVACDKRGELQHLPQISAHQPPEPLREVTRSGGNSFPAASWAQVESQLLQRLSERLLTQKAAEGGAEASLFLPPADPSTGWCVLNVAILAPPRLFGSELQRLLDEVFPRLNRELHPHKIFLLPLVLGEKGDARHDSKRAGADFRYLHFALACDPLADVVRSRFVTLELLGDRAGDYEHPSASDLLAILPCSSAAATLPLSKTRVTPPLHPLLYTLHEAALQSTRYLLVAVRRGTKHMGVPPALAPLLSAEPHIENPDTHHSLVKKLLPPSTLCPSSSDSALYRLEYDRADEVRAWHEHLAFCANVRASLPVPELLVDNYKASFSRIDQEGNICLADLDEFTEAVYQRLHLLFAACVPPLSCAVASGPSLRMNTPFFPGWLHAPLGYGPRLLQRVAHQRSEVKLLVESMAAGGGMKRSLMGRLNLYLATPPSRNSFILCAEDTTMLTETLAAVAASRFAVTRYPSHNVRACLSTHAWAGVAFHSTRNTVLQDEPTDAHTVMRCLLSQLTSNVEVLRYAALEVDIMRLRAFFLGFLAGHAPADMATTKTSAVLGAAAEVSRESWVPAVTAATLSVQEPDDQTATGPATASAAQPTQRTYVVIIDGIDAIDALVLPCRALRVFEETGEDLWSSATDGKLDTQEKLMMGRTCLTAVPDDILPRYLARNVRVLCSCNVSPGEGNGASIAKGLALWGRDSMEVFHADTNRSAEVERRLSEAGLEAVGITLTDDEFDMVCSKNEAQDSPEYLGYLVNALRRNAEEAGYLSQSQLLQQLPSTVEGMARGVHDSLIASFGDALTYEVLGLLSVARWGIPEIHLRSFLSLPPGRFRQLLRLLRPATEPPRSSSFREVENGNALLNNLVRLVSPAFKHILARLRAERNAARAVGGGEPRPPKGLLQQHVLSDESADHRVWHEQLARHYLRVVHRSTTAFSVPWSSSSPLLSPAAAATSSESPYERHAVKELPFHLAKAGLWDTISGTVLSPSYLLLVYRHGLAYPYLRDLTAAFNAYHAQHKSEESGAVRNVPGAEKVDGDGDGEGGEGVSEGKGHAMFSFRLRDYIYFVREKSRQLLENPSLVLQVCVEQFHGFGGCVRTDTQRFILKAQHQHLTQRMASPADMASGQLLTPTAPVASTLLTQLESAAYFIIANAKKNRKLHHGPVRAICFTPNGMSLISGSADRTLCWLNPTQSGVPLFYVRQPETRVQSIVCCSANVNYIAALTENRTIYVYDVASGKLVSHSGGFDASGATIFKAPITSFCFSAHGRYYFVATDDLTLRAFDPERSSLLFELTWRDLLLCQGEEERGEARGASKSTLDRLSLFAKRNYIHVVPHPSDDEEFVSIINTHLRYWRVSDAKDGCVSILSEPAVLCGAVRQVEWLGAVDMHGMATTASVAAPYLLLTYIDHGQSVDLYSLQSRQVVRHFLLPNTASVQRVALSNDQECVAIATAEGEVMVYRLGIRSYSLNTQGNHRPPGAPAVAMLHELGASLGSDGLPMTVCPHLILQVSTGCFSEAGCKIIELAFHNGRSALLTLGNKSEIAYWDLREAAADANNVVKGCSPQLGDACTISQPQGRCFLPYGATCWGIAPTRDCGCREFKAVKETTSKLVKESCDIAVGDDSGHVTLLNIWKPFYVNDSSACTSQK